MHSKTLLFWNRDVQYIAYLDVDVLCVGVGL